MPVSLFTRIARRACRSHPRGAPGLTLALASAALLNAGPAQALDLAFTIVNEPAPPDFNYMGRPQVDGQVSGVLRGLADDGASAPTALDFTSGGEPIGLTARHVGRFTSVSGGLLIEGGQVMAGGLLLNFDDPVVGALLLTVNASGFYGSGLNVLAWNGGTGPVLSLGNARGLAGAQLAAVSAVPEPAPGALLAAGLATLGWLARRRPVGR